MVYSKDEQTILAHFFTNTDKDVYFLQNFPNPEVAGLFLAAYSRNKKSMRDMFLDTILTLDIIADFNKTKSKENQIKDPDTFRAKFPGFAEGCFSKWAQIIKSTGDQLQEFTNLLDTKARSLFGIYADKYGHSSMMDMDHGLGFACENISNVFTKLLEDDTLGDYQEKSTRYVEFSIETVMMPKEFIGTKFERRLKNNTRKTMSAYKISLEKITNYLIKTIKPGSNISETAHNNACKAKAFDYSRGNLPIRTRTNMGEIGNIRTLSRQLSELLVNPLIEAREKALDILSEAQKLHPIILMNTQGNRYIQETNEDMYELVRSIESNIPNREPVTKNTVTLLEVAPDLEDRLIASMLYQFSNANKSWQNCYEHISNLKDSKKEEIVQMYLGKLKQESVCQNAVTGEQEYRTYIHPPMPALNEGNVKYELIVDYGAFRDIHRHRRCSQRRKAEAITCDLGYEMPPIYETVDIDAIFIDAQEDTKEVFDEARDSNEFHPAALQYIPTFAYRIPETFREDIFELFYTSRLRTTPQGQFSYRRIFQEMYNQAVPYLPIISQYITVDMDEYELGREKQEQKHIDTLAKVGV